MGSPNPHAGPRDDPKTPNPTPSSAFFKPETLWKVRLVVNNQFIAFSIVMKNAFIMVVNNQFMDINKS